MAGDLLEMLAAAELGDGNLVCATLLENLSGNLAAIDIRSTELDICAVCDCENLVKLNVADSIFSTRITSSTATRCCLPPATITAYI